MCPGASRTEKQPQVPGGDRSPSLYVEAPACGGQGAQREAQDRPAGNQRTRGLAQRGLLREQSRSGEAAPELPCALAERERAGTPARGRPGFRSQLSLHVAAEDTKPPQRPITWEHKRPWESESSPVRLAVASGTPGAGPVPGGVGRVFRRPRRVN